jgi:hypothetical protein
MCFVCFAIFVCYVVSFVYDFCVLISSYVLGLDSYIVGGELVLIWMVIIKLNVLCCLVYAF